jgi:hypothetical protein
MRDIGGSDCEPLRCSFCGKAQESVGKLISSPSAHSRACICDECVAICASIIVDDRAQAAPTETDASGEPHPLLSHPLASEFMASVAEWIRHESLGRDAYEEPARVRGIAAQMIAGAGE